MTRERDPLTDPELKMCSRRWDDGARIGGHHQCAEFGPHDTHRCCCGAEEPRTDA